MARKKSTRKPAKSSVKKPNPVVAKVVKAAKKKVAARKAVSKVPSKRPAA